MKFPTRRAFAALLPSLGLAQQTSQKTPRGQILPTGAFIFEKLRLRQSENMKTYPILSGTTHSGFNLDLHETELAPGGVPHPPHQHVHEELLFVREGELDLIRNEGTTRLGPGSCAYMASNDQHGYRNPGAKPAKYFVLALGTDAT
jgi:quercetin dioxygenase-like cupin family protein